MNRLIRKWLLMPFSLLYGIGVSLRNVFYDTELLKGSRFNIPVINVGNLSLGGAGKTPHVEYLAAMLNPYLPIGILSRGYKRKTKGFHIVERGNSALQSGDEPVMYKRKNPALHVAVSESRALGIPLLLQKIPSIRVILLDDAFQHRSVEAGINILLTPQYDLFTQDALLPSGRLREYRSAYARAHIIIVSKCDPLITEDQKSEIIEEINPLPNQMVFFSRYQYNNAYNILNGQERITNLKDYNVILISAIASTDYLLDYLEEACNTVNVMKYEDHHFFSSKDMDYITKVYKNAAENTIILTTEKDAIRLQHHHAYIKEQQLAIFALPIKVEFLGDDGKVFEHKIKDYLLNFKV